MEGGRRENVGFLLSLLKTVPQAFSTQLSYSNWEILALEAC